MRYAILYLATTDSRWRSYLPDCPEVSATALTRTECRQETIHLLEEWVRKQPNRPPTPKTSSGYVNVYVQDRPQRIPNGLSPECREDLWKTYRFISEVMDRPETPSDVRDLLWRLWHELSAVATEPQELPDSDDTDEDEGLSINLTVGDIIEGISSAGREDMIPLIFTDSAGSRTSNMAIPGIESETSEPDPLPPSPRRPRLRVVK